MAKKTNAEIEQEYQDTLKVSQSLLGDIQKLLNDNVDAQGEMTGASKAYNKTLESILGDITSYEDLLDGIVKLEREKSDWLSMANEFGEEAVKRETAALDVAVKSLRNEEKKLVAIQAANNVAMEFSDNLTSGLDTFQDNIKSIPVFGGMLSSITKGPVDNLKGAIGNTAKTFVSDFGGALRDGKGSMEALAFAGRGAGAGIKAAFAGPQAIIAAVVAVIAAGVFAFYKIGEAAKAFRQETGLLNSQTESLDGQIQRVAQQTAGLGASMEEVSSAAAAFAKQFGNTQLASDAVVKSTIVLNKNFGIGVESAVAVNEQFQRMAGVSAETAQNMLQTTVEAARLAGVAPNQVIADIAENSEVAYKFFNGSVGDLSKAAIEAAKLGTSIGQAADLASQLLDFESSIGAELNASAMLGTNINFNEARRLAASKDIIGAQKAVIKEVSKLGDLTKLSVFEQEALAEAAGMPIGDLIKQQQIQQNLGDLGEDQLAAANALIAKGMQARDITKEQLNAETERLAKQQEMQTEFDSMGNALKAIGTDLLLSLAPIGKAFVGIIKFFAPIVSGFFSIIGDSLKRVFAAVNNLMAPFKEIFGGESSEGLTKVLKFVGEILGRTIATAIGVIARTIDGVANVIGGVFKIIKGIFTLDFSMIGEGIMQAIGGILEFIYAMPLAIFDTFVDLFDSLLGLFGSIGQKIKTFISNLIPDWVKNLFTVGGSDAAAVQSEAAQMQVAGSIEDGIVQNGKIVTTDPADSIIATKTPQDLMSQLVENSPIGLLGKAVGGIGDMIGGAFGSENQSVGNEQIIAKFDEMIAAFKGGKDVYMDGKKVTSGVNRVVDNVGTNSYSLG